MQLGLAKLFIFNFTVDVRLLYVNTPSIETSRVLLGLACFSFDLKIFKLSITYPPS